MKDLTNFDKNNTNNIVSNNNTNNNNKNSLKLISWNVNGFRAILQKGFLDFVNNEKPDILCLQETKAHPEQIDVKMSEFGYEYEYFNSAQKKGYSGTAIFSKIKPLNISYGMGIEKHDNEGRIITLEFDKFYLLVIYTPNSQRALERLEYRLEWEKDFLNYLKKLETKKPIIFCGDLNVAHTEIDLANPQTNKTTKTKPGSAGFSDSERFAFTKLLEAGFIDTYRFFNPTKIKYTWWSYMFNARTKNVGWRIDYFIVSQSLKENLVEAEILNEIIGSDHCPVKLIVKDL